MDVDLQSADANVALAVAGLCMSLLGTQPARVGRWAARSWVVVGVGLIGVIAPAVWAVSPASSTNGSGTWVWPLVPTPEIVGAFDPPDEPWLPGHRGVDLAAEPGQAVHAAGTGQVTLAGQIAGVGVVVINHGELRTTYEPVNPTVGLGETVAAGQVIGRLATAGGHCLPETCLHWGLLRGDTYLNPLLLVGGGPVRLLPLSGSGLDPAPMLTDQIPADPAPALRASGVVFPGSSDGAGKDSLGELSSRARAERARCPGSFDPIAGVGWRLLAMGRRMGSPLRRRRRFVAAILGSMGTGRAPPISRSSAWMGLQIGLAQSIGRDVGVELGGRE